MSVDDDKHLAACAAVEEVRAGMSVGLGTGTTAAFAIARLGEKVRGGLAIRAVATSLASASLARAHGIVVEPMDALDRLDLAIDGADEIDDRLFAIKGAGGAMLREKVIAAAARRMVVIADGSKRVTAIGAAPVPLEVLPLAGAFVAARVRALGGMPAARPGYLTDQGNIVLDCRFVTLDDPAALAARLAAIPGMLGHGLFLGEVDAAYIAVNGNVTRLERPPSTV